jgi:hypothetical protein
MISSRFDSFLEAHEGVYAGLSRIGHENHWYAFWIHNLWLVVQWLHKQFTYVWLFCVGSKCSGYVEPTPGVTFYEMNMSTISPNTKFAKIYFDQKIIMWNNDSFIWLWYPVITLRRWIYLCCKIRIFKLIHRLPCLSVVSLLTAMCSKPLPIH